MKKFLKLIFYLPLLLSGVLTSCDNSDNNKIQYFAFKEDDSDMWGLISSEGKVLVSDRFEQIPTLVKEDRFWVKDEDGFYQLYSVSENPQLVVDLEYAYVSDFSKGRAVVAERDGEISIIDKDGKETSKLDKIGGKTVSWVKGLSEGFAVYCANDSLQGMINKDGECILNAQKGIVTDMKEGHFLSYDEFYIGDEPDSLKLNTEIKNMRKKFKVNIYDEKGTKLLSFNRSDYPIIGLQFQSGLLPVATEENGEYKWGLINDKGEQVVKPSSKYEVITEVRGKNFIFKHGDKYGVAALDGKKVINAQYSDLQFASDDMLIASTSDMNIGDDPVYFLLNLNGDKPSSTKYMHIIPYYMFDGNCAPVMKKEGMWQLLNDKGEKLEKATDISQMGADSGSSKIYSDYLDMGAFIDSLGLTAQGIGDATLNMSVETALNLQATEWGNSSKLTPSDYASTSNVYLFPKAGDINYNVKVDFPKNLSHQTYRDQKVIDYVNYYYGYYYYHINKIPTGYKFNSMTPSKLEIDFYQYVSPMYGKMRKLYNALAKHVKSLGDVDKENNSAMIVNLSSGNKMLLAMQEDKVIIRMGKLSSSEQEIYEYANAKEKLGEQLDIQYNGSGVIDNSANIGNVIAIKSYLLEEGC